MNSIATFAISANLFEIKSR